MTLLENNDNLNFYQILDVPESATFEQIKKSYRTLSFKYHPDKTGDDTKKNNYYKKIVEAYDTLKDNTLRKQYDYDLFLNNTLKEQQNMNNNLDNIMEDLFSTFNNINKSKKSKQSNFNNPFFNMAFSNMNDYPNMEQVVLNSAMPATSQIFNIPPEPEEEFYNEDLVIEHTITYEEAYTGLCAPISIVRDIRKGKVKNFDKTYEQETIYIDIPAGIDNLEFIVLEKKGNIVNDNKSDLKVQILIEPHDKFFRKGLHLCVKHNITFKESLCGFKFDITHLNGSTFSLNSSRGNVIQNGDTKTIKELGFNRYKMTGDLIIYFNVIAPKKLDEEKLKILEENL